MEIILAKASDKEEILKLYRDQIKRDCCPWNENYPGMPEIEFDLSRNSVFVMKDEQGKIISSISIDEDKEVEELDCWSKELYPGGELSRLAVRIDYQNQGIARTMLSYGMEELKRRGFKSVHFLVNKHNEKAIRSYAHMNFNNVGETTLFEQPFWCYEKVL